VPRAMTLGIAATVALGVIVLAALTVLVELHRPEEGRALAGVEVDDADLGDRDEDEVRERVADLGAERERAGVTIRSAAGEVTTSRRAIGHTTDPEATVEDVMARGRQPWLAALPDAWRAVRDRPVPVAMVEERDVDQARQRAAAVAGALSRDPADAEVTLVERSDPAIEVQDAEVGADLDAQALAELLGGLVQEGTSDAEVEAVEEVREPEIGDADAQAARQHAEALLADAIELTNPADAEDVTLQPEDLAAALSFVPEPDAEPGERLAVELDPELLEEQAQDRFADAEIEPVDADVVLVDREPQVQEGEDGFALDLDETVARIHEAAQAEEREAELAGEVIEPDRTTEDAEDLGITELVSEFTTPHACCQPRVHNIQLMADTIAGTIVEPGESFSINEHVGPRTAEKGYQADGVIIRGEFEDRVGGGVSQYATTFFNAAFFAGVQLDEFQPHSYYISRYPEGREATLSYGALDVRFTNDTDYGILIGARYTDTSITVELWSTDHREVSAWSSDRYNVVEGDVRDGFDIDFGRTVTYSDGSQRSESWSHRYQPEDDDEEDDEDEDDEDDESSDEGDGNGEGEDAEDESSDEGEDA